MYDAQKHNRQSIRLKGYDYSQPGYYFVAICVANRYCLFGKVSEDRVHLNKYGEIARKEWLLTEDLRDNVRLDEFVVMPNHVHGIIELIDSRDTARRVPAKEKSANLQKILFQQSSDRINQQSQRQLTN